MSLKDGFDRNLKHTFGCVADIYDDFRPDYPQSVIDHLFSLANISSSSSILELGCGTGKATKRIPADHKVLAIDHNDNMLDYAKQLGLSHVIYAVFRFEDFSSSKTFDLVIAAQSWHWFDPVVAYDKVANLLTDQGSLALLWNFPNYDESALLRAVRERYVLHCPKFPKDFGSVQKHYNRLREHDSFSHIYTYDCFAGSRKTVEEFVGYVKTLSWVRSLPEQKREDFFTDLESVISSFSSEQYIPFRTTLLVARKNPVAHLGSKLLGLVLLIVCFLL